MVQLQPIPQAPLRALRTPFRVLQQLIFGRPTMQALDTEFRAETAQLGRKRSKLEAVYTPVFVVPPLAWEYTCRACRYFQPATKTCSQVGLPSDPWGGEAIGELAWCAIWLPIEGEPLLKWAVEVIEGQR